MEPTARIRVHSYFRLETSLAPDALIKSSMQYEPLSPNGAYLRGSICSSTKSDFLLPESAPARILLLFLAPTSSLLSIYLFLPPRPLSLFTALLPFGTVLP